MKRNLFVAVAIGTLTAFAMPLAAQADVFGPLSTSGGKRETTGAAIESNSVARGGQSFNLVIPAGFGDRTATSGNFGGSLSPAGSDRD